MKQLIRNFTISPVKSLIFPLILTLLLTGAPSYAQQKKLHIVTLNFPAFDFSRVIAGNRAQVDMLLPPGSEAHGYEPTPKDLISIQNADLLVYTGGHADAWVEQVIASFGAKAPKLLRMMDVVQTVAEEIIEGMEDISQAHTKTHNHDHEDEKDKRAHKEERELDEHVWTSPQNATLIATAIAQELETLDPHGKEIYQANLHAYTEQLAILDEQFRQMIDKAKRKTIVIGDRFPMRYFAMAYGLSYYAAFPGCAAQTEPNAKIIAFLINKVQKEKIPVVFYIEFSTGRAANAIAEQTGAKTALLHSIHNVTQEQLDEGVSYLSLMKQNLSALQEALN